MKTKFHGHKNRLLHPDGERELEAGEEFDATDLWLRQHQPYVNKGVLTVTKPAPKKKAPAKKKAAK